MAHTQNATRTEHKMRMIKWTNCWTVVGKKHPVLHNVPSSRLFKRASWTMLITPNAPYDATNDQITVSNPALLVTITFPRPG
jgi:hypothetical protein